MKNIDPDYYNKISNGLSDSDFIRLSNLIYSESGIKMNESKRTMLEARLQKRLRILGIPTLKDYTKYLFSSDGMDNEVIQLIDVVTTNKTEFFRENGHFDFMTQKGLQNLIKKFGSGTRRKLMVWSAGCSIGEEPYTLAMVLNEFVETTPGFQFEILATDISTSVLEKASLGIYDEDRIEDIPEGLKKKYFLRSKDKRKNLVRIIPELRKMVKFRRLNFMIEDFGLREHMDIIFCRNVIIYFDRNVQEMILNKLCRHLIPGGYVFMGHSETLNGMNLPLVQVISTIYTKKE